MPLTLVGGSRCNVLWLLNEANIEGIICMATKSILKNIVVDNDAAAESLAEALEHAQNKGHVHVSIRRKVHEVKGSSIKRMFEGR
jgi:hypothetical protein